MMSQIRQSQKDRLRADLEYQINSKNELAQTELLRRMDLLESERLPRLFGELSESLKCLPPNQSGTSEGS